MEGEQEDEMDEMTAAAYARVTTNLTCAALRPPVKEMIIRLYLEEGASKSDIRERVQDKFPHERIRRAHIDYAVSELKV